MKPYFKAQASCYGFQIKYFVGSSDMGWFTNRAVWHSVSISAANSFYVEIRTRESTRERENWIQSRAKQAPAMGVTYVIDMEITFTSSRSQIGRSKSETICHIIVHCGVKNFTDDRESCYDGLGFWRILSLTLANHFRSDFWNNRKTRQLETTFNQRYSRVARSTFITNHN